MGAEFKYHKVAESILDYIQENRLFPGKRLPGIRELAAAFGVSKNTVVKALDYLSDEGIVTLQEKQGACVAEKAWVAEKGFTVWQRYEKPASAGVAETEFYSHIRAASARKPAIGTACTSDEFGADGYIQKAMMDLASMMNSRSISNSIWLPEGIQEDISFHLRNKGIHAMPDNIILTSGPASSISYVLKTFLKRGMYLLVEDPSSAYYFINQFASDLGATTVPVGMDEEGVILEEIARPKYTRRALLLISSVHQYPTGRNMSERRKRELLTLCKQMQIPIIEHDSFSDCIGADSIKTMDTEDIVIYSGSIRHTFALGLRVSWMVAPDYLAGNLVRTKQQQSIYNDVISASLMAILLKKGYYYDFLDGFLPKYEGRVAFANDLLERHLGDIATWNRKDGGFLFWVDFGNVNAKQIFQHMDVLVSYGSMFSTNNRYKNYISFCPFSATEAELETIFSKVRVLAQAS